MKKLLCKLGIHNFVWGEVKTEDWSSQMYNAWTGYVGGKREYARDLQEGRCDGCGLFKKRYLS